MPSNQDKVFIAVVLAGALAVSIILPLLRTLSAPKYISSEAIGAIGATWQNILLSKIEVSVAGANAASGFVSASIKTLPNYSAPAAERIAGQYFERFDSYAQLLLATNPVIMSMQLQAGGAVSQTVPPNLSIGFDVLATNQRADVLATAQSGAVTIGGPRALVQGGFALIVRVPAYNTSLPYRNLSSWWGSIINFVNATRFVQDIGIWEQLRREGVEWVLAVNGTLVQIGMDNRTKTREAIMKEGRPFVITLRSSAVWVLWLYAPGQPAMDTGFIVTVVVGSFACALTAIVLYFAVRKILSSMVVQVAPPKLPLAYCVVTILKTDDLWNAVSADMVVLCRTVETQLATVAARHACYVTKSLAQHCFVVAAPSVEAGLEVSLSLMEWCHTPNAFPEDIAGMLKLHQLAVECSGSIGFVGDASTARKVTQGDLCLYEGPEVSATVKLSRRAQPNIVLLSEAAFACLTPPQVEKLIVVKKLAVNPSRASPKTPLASKKPAPNASFVYAVTRNGLAEQALESVGSISSSCSSMVSIQQNSNAKEFRASQMYSRPRLVELLTPQASVLGIDPTEVQDVAWIFLLTYQTMFRPLAQQEMASVERHLEQAFGIKRQGNVVEQLALACVMQHISLQAGDLESSFMSSDVSDQASSPVHESLL